MLTTGKNQLLTRAGPIPFPAYIPVTTFGDKYPLDDLIRPYLPRLAPAVMVSLHYAQQMEERPRLPLLVDSGGFACLFKNATLTIESGLGVIERENDDTLERIHPCEVLEFQERVADVAFTLDFPIPPSTDEKEAKRRLELTIANAQWALENRRRRDLPLYACIQGWDLKSYKRCAEAYRDSGFDGIAIGGLVPRLRDWGIVRQIVDAIRDALPNFPLHVFGVGKPGFVKEIFAAGIQSVDSSSYVKLAAQGRTWSRPGQTMENASPMERVQLALLNLSVACDTRLPLSAYALLADPFRTPSLTSSRSPN